MKQSKDLNINLIENNKHSFSKNFLGVGSSNLNPKTINNSTISKMVDFLGLEIVNKDELENLRIMGKSLDEKIKIRMELENQFNILKLNEISNKLEETKIKNKIAKERNEALKNKIDQSMFSQYKMIDNLKRYDNDINNRKENLRKFNEYHVKEYEKNLKMIYEEKALKMIDIKTKLEEDIFKNTLIKEVENDYNTKLNELTKNLGTQVELLNKMNEDISKTRSDIINHSNKNEINEQTNYDLKDNYEKGELHLHQLNFNKIEEISKKLNKYEKENYSKISSNLPEKFNTYEEYIKRKENEEVILKNDKTLQNIQNTTTIKDINLQKFEKIDDKKKDEIVNTIKNQDNNQNNKVEFITKSNLKSGSKEKSNNTKLNTLNNEKLESNIDKEIINKSNTNISIEDNDNKVMKKNEILSTQSKDKSLEKSNNEKGENKKLNTNIIINRSETGKSQNLNDKTVNKRDLGNKSQIQSEPKNLTNSSIKDKSLTSSSRITVEKEIAILLEKRPLELSKVSYELRKKVIVAVIKCLDNYIKTMKSGESLYTSKSILESNKKVALEVFYKILEDFNEQKLVSINYYMKGNINSVLFLPFLLIKSFSKPNLSVESLNSKDFNEKKFKENLFCSDIFVRNIII